MYEKLMELVSLLYCHTLYTGKWVDCILISVKNYDHSVEELAVLSRAYELEHDFGKTGLCLKPNALITKPFSL